MAQRPGGPLERAVASVGDRWTLLVVAALLDGPLRFNQLAEAVPGLAPNILSRRLRHLEEHGLVVAAPYSRRPPRLTYELSASGRELAGALSLLASWGGRRSNAEHVRHHGACGTPVEARWWCPTCDRPVDEAEGEELHFL